MFHRKQRSHRERRNSSSLWLHCTVNNAEGNDEKEVIEKAMALVERECCRYSCCMGEGVNNMIIRMGQMAAVKEGVTKE